MSHALHKSMTNRTMYLPGFSGLMRRSRAQTTATQVMREASAAEGLAKLVANFIPTELFATKDGGRERMFTPMVTFTAFLGQVMSRGSSCREAVRLVQTWFLAASKQSPDDSTSAYCQARGRLELAQIRAAFRRVCGWFEDKPVSKDLWGGRRVMVMDGTGISMPDTKANREVYEYAGGQKEGCGFPTGKLLGLFSLASGHLHQFVQGNWKEHDISMARSVVGWVDIGDIVVADRGFCGWSLMALLARKNVDVVLRLHQARRPRGDRDEWAKPQRQGDWDTALWAELPESISVRIVHYRIEEPGFRTKEVTLVTTLLDTRKYPDKTILDLYLRRWRVELSFRDIKTTLGLDILRTKSPALVEKEIYMQAIAYNIVRGVMLQSAQQYDEDLERMSFKGTVDTLRQWTRFMGQRDPKLLNARWHDLLCALAADLVPHRPNRSEPRAVKRRPKVYQQLTGPRDKMVVSKSRRNRGAPNASKSALT